MSLVEEYKNQNTWRDWDSYLERLPIDNKDTIFDLGCSIGVVSKLLAKKAHQVVGLDNNPELLKEALCTNSAENISYLNRDLGSLNFETLPVGDGIWSSFVAAYFPDFESILNGWKNIIKTDGWIALVEMSDLLSHEPLSKFAQDALESYSERQRQNESYDFKMGEKLKEFVNKCGLSIIHEEDMFDRELTFNGPAEPKILRSWASRFDRMEKFIEYVGEKDFYKVKGDFLECMSDKNHKSNSIVKFILAKK